MKIRKFFVVLAAGLALAGCGQLGPLYPAAQQSKPEHKYDEFLLQSSKPMPTSATTTAVNPTTSVVLPIPFSQQ